MTNFLPRQIGLSTKYVLDANIFMSAWHDHYPIDIYPGFWACLIRFRQEERLLSVDRVRDEINSPNELVDWLKQHWHGAFASTRNPEIARAFSRMQTWVYANPQFLRAAKDEFAQVADGWLAAYAKAHNAIVVTNEVFDPNVKRRVPLPNLCCEFQVKYCNTIDMLRELGVTFDLRTHP